MNKGRVIAAVRTDKELMAAIKSNTDTIFMLAPNIQDIKRQIDAVHTSGKRIFVHIDLAEGIGKDEYGIRFIKEQGADGIISTRSSIIKLAKKEKIPAVQRFFAVDSKSVATAIDTAKSTKADMIEIMPGTLTKVIQKLKSELDVPVVAGGLIETAEEIKSALASGAIAVSTGKSDFWGM